jgi:hypothetical protein
MSNITRRQALTCALAGILAPCIISPPEPLESELVDLGDFEPKPFGNPSDWTPPQVCRLFAAWELSAQQGNLPDTWRTLCYDGAFQWSNGEDGRVPLIAWYGIGPAEWTVWRMHNLLEFIADGGPEVALAHERIAQGRAFAIVSVGSLSPGLRRELDRPAWWRVRPPEGPWDTEGTL